MKKLFTLLVSILAVTLAMAQQQSAEFKKVTTDAPVIDGVIDDVWDAATTYTIERPSGTPSLGEAGETSWKGMWDEQGVYILLKVTDNEFYPNWAVDPKGNSWEYDKPELYFDVNMTLEDAGGPNGSNANHAGHYQFAPEIPKDKIDGTFTEDNGFIYAFKVTQPNYVAEYFIPYSKLTSNNNTEVDRYQEIGFDVTIIDRDPGDAQRSAAIWSNNNDGGAGESWDNMDHSGRVTFEGIGEKIDITKLTVSGGNTITTDNGTVQLTAAVEPANATQAYKWVLSNETGLATINETGLVSALRNGVVKVKAVSADDFTSSDEITITISGQKISMAEINLIKNGKFDQGADGKANWVGGGVAAAVIEDNYYNQECTPKTYIWDTMFGQGVKGVDGTTKYIVKFKAKASADMVVPTLFEDRGNNNDKVVTSSSPYRGSERWDIPVTTEEQTFTFDVVFSNKKDNSAYELNFQVGMVTGTFSISDIMMYTEADLALVDPSAAVKAMDANSAMRVYPNPVSSILNVELRAINAKVAIYNSLGQKITEKTATGTKVTFDVSGLQKGLYFVKTSDGVTQKFIR